jgi:group I intron endonuclease
MEKISAVYKIVNTVTGDCYVGSSKNVTKRWADHKCPSTWMQFPNSQLYEDMQKYGVDKFRFQILVPVMSEYLKQVEQELIEMLKPTYNKINASGYNVDKRIESNRRYQQSEKFREYRKKYEKSEKRKDYKKKYRKSEKGKEIQKNYWKSKKMVEYNKERNNKPCMYNGETLTLNALVKRFRRAGIEHPTLEAKKYLLP